MPSVHGLHGFPHEAVGHADEADGAKPRVLADDIMVSVAGAESYETFVPIFNATLQYCKDLGARVAPDKSFTFSTDKKVRKKLVHHFWMPIHATLNVLRHTRDLGTHLSFGASLIGTTINNRVEEAIKIVN